MALDLCAVGTLEFTRIAALLMAGGTSLDLYWLTGLALIFTALASNCRSRRSICGRPTSMKARRLRRAFVAVVSKGAMFASCSGISLRPTPTVSSGADDDRDRRHRSILVGNLLALLQNNIKRILAYSSIAHLGYLLVAFLAGGALRLRP